MINHKNHNFWVTQDVSLKCNDKNDNDMDSKALHKKHSAKKTTDSDIRLVKAQFVVDDVESTQESKKTDYASILESLGPYFIPGYRRQSLGTKEGIIAMFTQVELDCFILMLEQKKFQDITQHLFVIVDENGVFCLKKRSTPDWIDARAFWLELEKMATTQGQMRNTLHKDITKPSETIKHKTIKI